MVAAGWSRNSAGDLPVAAGWAEDCELSFLERWAGFRSARNTFLGQLADVQRERDTFMPYLAGGARHRMIIGERLGRGRWSREMLRAAADCRRRASQRDRSGLPNSYGGDEATRLALKM